MLTLTKNATDVVRSLTERPNTTGLRIAGRRDASKGFAVTTAEAPQASDQVVEQDGATVYLDEEAAMQLDNQVLDAGTDSEGNLQFALSMQD